MRRDSSKVRRSAQSRGHQSAQLLDLGQPVLHGVNVHVHFLRGRAHAHAGGQERPQRRQQIAAALAGRGQAARALDGRAKSGTRVRADCLFCGGVRKFADLAVRTPDRAVCVRQDVFRLFTERSDGQWTGVM
jgi:hypothetical protein